MNNRDNYKNTFSNIRPSNESVERIMDMTVDKKKSCSKQNFKKIASVALALVILVVGGGLGINHFADSRKPLSVKVAYADEFMSIKSGTKQTIVNGVYFAPADDAKKNKEQLAKAEKDCKDIVSEIENFDNDDEWSGAGVGKYDVYDKEGELVAKLYTSSAGFFVADKSDYKNVKSFTVENKSEDGYLQFEWADTVDLLVNQTDDTVDPENPYSLIINHKFTLTGDELRRSKGAYNEYGYSVVWLPTASIFEEYKYTKDIEAKDITDTITFTFVYEDGTVESAYVNISFDDYGHMQIS